MRCSIILSALLCPLFLLAARGAETTGAEWQSFTVKAGRFTVRLPAKPTYHEKVMDSPVGDVIDKVYQVDASNRLYHVVFTDYPKELAQALSPKDRLKEYTKGIKEGGKVLQEKKRSLGTNPGMELVYKTSRGFVRHSTYMVADRAYHLVLTAKTREATADALADKFFNSFALTEQASKK